MGLLKGNLSFLSFKVAGELPPNFRGVFEERIRFRAFKERLDARTGDENIGWVNIIDPDDIDLNLNAFLYGNYLVLGLRIDKKTVNAALLRIMTQRQVKETMEAKGAERLSASHKRDIKEAVHEELLQRALPSVRVFDMAWDIDTGEVRLFTTSQGVADIFRIFFRDTFELELEYLKLAHWLHRGGLTPKEIETGVDSLRQHADFRA